MKKKQYRTVFISDIHLGNLKNQWKKLVKFLDSILFDNLVIIWDFLDYRQLSRFWKRTKQDENTLNYINNLAKNWVNTTYIQWNHDRQLKCSDKIHIENMTIRRKIYYKTLKWKTYYITHWDCMDWINNKLTTIWKIWSIMFWLLFRIENFWNKKTFQGSYVSLGEKLDNRIKKRRMPDKKINRKIIKFTKNLNCDWIIIWHFHIARHYDINWLDYFNTWDWLKNYAAVVEDLKWNLELILC